MAKPGIFIAVDGIDGAGKTTQVERLRRRLEDAGETVVASKEPTNGVWGRRLRESATLGRLSPEDELAAFIEDRREHVREVILPSLADGKVVIVDRYFYSTIAYQGIRRTSHVESLFDEMRAEFPIPDITFLFDVMPEVGLHRVSVSRGDIPNEFERLDELRRIREVFLVIAKNCPEVRVIDGHPNVDAVFHECAHLLVDGPLRAKRCAKPYGCDIFYCSYRANGECTWAAERSRLLAV